MLRSVPLPRGHVKRDWFKSAQDELRTALHLEYNTNVAKNVIIFVGDGMGFTNNWASRLYAGQYKHNQSGEEYQFHFEKFPHLGIAKVSGSCMVSVRGVSGTCNCMLSGDFMLSGDCVLSGDCIEW